MSGLGSQSTRGSCGIRNFQGAPFMHRPVTRAHYATTTLPPQAEERDRTKIPNEDKWDLTPIYVSDEAWRIAKVKLGGEIPKMRQFQGKLASAAGNLVDALDLQSDLDKELTRLFVYASMHSDEDTRVSLYQGMEQEMIQLGSVLGTECAYVEPEILKMDDATIQRFLTEEPRL